MTSFYTFGGQVYIDYCEKVIGIDKVQGMTVGQIVELMAKEGKALRQFIVNTPEEAYEVQGASFPDEEDKKNA
mgnify:CR=1 FL=1